MKSRRLLFVLCALTAQLAFSDTLKGYVVGITDGNTLTMLVDKQQHKIQISGIDAPVRVQAFGEKAKSHMALLTFNKDAIAYCHKKSQDRKVCKVLIEGRDIGLQQIEAGKAWWSRRYSSEQTAEDRTTYEQAELMAKLRRLGLWADTNPVPPWEWRYRLK